MKLNYTPCHKHNRFLKEVIEKEAYNYLFIYPVVIDIGANIGTFSFWMYDRSHTIYAVEPVEDCYNLMVQTITENNLTKIKPYKLAIAGDTGRRTMIRAGDPHSGGWGFNEEGDYPVEAKTLATFMENEGIRYADLVKIDVEGAELEIFRDPTFPFEMVGTIIGELHPPATNKEQRTEIQELLVSKGFTYWEHPYNYFLARKK